VVVEKKTIFNVFGRYSLQTFQNLGQSCRMSLRQKYSAQMRVSFSVGILLNAE